MRAGRHRQRCGWPTHPPHPAQSQTLNTSVDTAQVAAIAPSLRFDITEDLLGINEPSKVQNNLEQVLNLPPAKGLWEVTPRLRFATLQRL